MGVDRVQAARSVADLDALGVRIPGAGHELSRERGRRPTVNDHWIVDLAPCFPANRPDMIVARSRRAPPAAVTRCASPERSKSHYRVSAVALLAHARWMTRELLAHGAVVTSGGHSIRVAAFGGSVAEGTYSLGIAASTPEVVQYLRAYPREHWAILRHAKIKDPAFVFLLCSKVRRRAPADRSVMPEDPKWRFGMVICSSGNRRERAGERQQPAPVE